MVFYGEYIVSFTEGARLVLPKKIREVIKGSEFVLTKGFDNALSGFSKEDWEKRSHEFLSSSLINTENIELRRILFSGAVYVEIDEQGRFVLPKTLLNYLNIKAKAIFVGVGDHFELWDNQAWEGYLEKARQKTELINKHES